MLAELIVAPIFCGILKVEKLAAATFCESAITVNAMIAESFVKVFLIFIDFLLFSFFISYPMSELRTVVSGLSFTESLPLPVLT